MNPRRKATVDELPKVEPWLLQLFGRYAKRYVRRHFSSVRILRGSVTKIEAARPLVVFLNHASWWDPLSSLLLSQRYFTDRTSYAPIDARALKRYKFFQKLGFFGVEGGTVRGASRFLRSSEAILKHAQTAIWITPQGQFADVRIPAKIQGGLGHLMCRVPNAIYLPLAIEYAFWEERCPEILVHFGQPIDPLSGAM